VAGEAVVLVHGLWMNGLELALLGRRLGRCGFRPVRFDYHSVRDPVAHNARRLARRVRRLGSGPVHLVGHSLGGLVILRALSDYPDLPPGRVVLLGVPVTGSEVARHLARSGLGRHLLGRSLEGGLLGGAPVPLTGREVGTIAGTRSLGVGRVFGGLAGTCDGTVAVAETRLPGAATVTVRTTHTGLVLSAAVARQVCAFLRDGAFLAPTG